MSFRQALLFFLSLLLTPPLAAQSFEGTRTNASMWGIAEGPGLVAATGTDSVLATFRTGQTWKTRRLNNDPLLLGITVMEDDAILAVGSTHGFVGGESLVLRSTDRGASFDAVSIGLGATLYEIEFLDDRIGHAAGSNGTLLRSEDSGRTWRRIDTGTGENLWAVHFFDPLRGLIGGGATPWQNNEKSTGVILRTEDGGRSWQQAHQGGFRISDFAFIDANTGYAAGVGGGLLKSTNGGKTWALVGQTPLGAIVNAIAFTGTGCGLAVGSGGAAFVTRDGGRTWPVRIQVTKGSFLEDLAPAREGGFWVSAGDGTLGRIILPAGC